MSYATLAEARAEGVTTDQADNTRLQHLLDGASSYIDRVTGWWFDAREQSLVFDGEGAECLWLPAPIIELTGVSIDGDALDLATVVQYGTVASRRHLRAARLARHLSTVRLDDVRGRPLWPEGRQNITVEGTFGFVLADGETPPPEIRDACIRLVVHNLARLADASGQDERRRAEVFRESTDGHSYELAGTLPGAAGAWRRGGILGDPAIDVMLAGFRRPSRAAVV